jgi:AraC-like DNA-binding protein
MRAFHSAVRKSGRYPALIEAVPAKLAAQLGAIIPLVRDSRLRRVLEMIESHPSRKIHDLALECNLSESHLRHLVKQNTGSGLGRLLTEQRMECATVFLAYTNMSIKEIASTVGYEHTSSFTRAFERHFRQTPSCYRQANCQYRLPAKRDQISI